MQPFFKSFRKIFYGNKPFNRRKHLRFQPQHRIECTVSYNTFGKTIACHLEIINIGRGGLLAITGEHKINPATQLELRVQLTENQRVFFLKGFVGRIYRKHGQKWYYASIEFDAFQDESIKLILDYAGV